MRKVLIVLGIALLLAVPVILQRGSRREIRYDPQILRAAARYGLDPNLIRAVAWQESRFRADARGRSGEIGLMQLRSPAAGEWAAAERVAPFAHEHVADPGTNTLAGAWYLAKLLERYPQTDNPLVYALADYNAGRTHVLRWNRGAGASNSAVFLSQIDYPGTRRYIERVLRRYDHYRSRRP